MTENDLIVEAYKHRIAIRSEHRSIKKQMQELFEREETLLEQLEWIHRTTHVIEGVALSISGARVEPVSEDNNPRWTEDYTNVGDGGTGLRLRRWRSTGGYDEVATNISMAARAARKAAIEYVLHGTIPETKGWIKHYVREES